MDHINPEKTESSKPSENGKRSSYALGRNDNENVRPALDQAASFHDLGVVPEPGTRCRIIRTQVIFARHIGELGVIERVDQSTAWVRPAKTLEPRLSPKGKLIAGPNYAVAWGLDQIGPIGALV
jgi:hypothetical protein